MIYYVNEAAFELPDFGFVDRTVNVLEAAASDGRTLGVLLARSPFLPGSSLIEMVQAHQEQERRSLRAWSLLFERDGVFDGVSGIELGVRWRSDDGLVYQRQAHLGLEREVLLFVANAPLEERATADGCMDRLLETLRFRRTA